MKNDRTDKERLKKIVNYWEQLKKEIKDKDITDDKIKNDKFYQWAITTPVFNIGEQTYQISNEFKDKYSNLPWDKVSIKILDINQMRLI